MSQFLRHGVVFVVLVPPPGPTHTAAHTIQDDLESTVSENMACDRRGNAVRVQLRAMSSVIGI